MVFFSLKDYEDNYEDLKNKYLSVSIEFEEIDFINEEIKKHTDYILIVKENPNLAFCSFFNPLTNYDSDAKVEPSIIKNPYLSIGSNIFRENRDAYLEIKNYVLDQNGLSPDKTKLKICETVFSNIVDYLETKLNGIKRNHNPNFQNFSRVKFHGSQIEFIELIKGLIENGNLKGKQKDIIENCKSFFEIEINNPDKTISDIIKRNNGSETLFLDKLKKSLFDYIQRKSK